MFTYYKCTWLRVIYSIYLLYLNHPVTTQLKPSIALTNAIEVQSTQFLSSRWWFCDHLRFSNRSSICICQWVCINEKIDSFKRSMKSIAFVNRNGTVLVFTLTPFPWDVNLMIDVTRYKLNKHSLPDHDYGLYKYFSCAGIESASTGASAKCCDTCVKNYNWMFMWTFSTWNIFN